MNKQACYSNYIKQNNYAVTIQICIIKTERFRLESKYFVYDCYYIENIDQTIAISITC